MIGFDSNLINIIIPNGVNLSTSNFYSAFSRMYKLKYIEIPYHKITNMGGIFDSCTNLVGSPVCGDKVTDMSLAYQNCSNLTGSPVCGNNVTDLVSAYCNCYNLTGSPACGEKVTNMFITY